MLARVAKCNCNNDSVKGNVRELHKVNSRLSLDGRWLTVAGEEPLHVEGKLLEPLGLAVEASQVWQTKWGLGRLQDFLWLTGWDSKVKLGFVARQGQRILVHDHSEITEPKQCLPLGAFHVGKPEQVREFPLAIDPPEEYRIFPTGDTDVSQCSQFLLLREDDVHLFAADFVSKQVTLLSVQCLTHKEGVLFRGVERFASDYVVTASFLWRLAVGSAGRLFAVAWRIGFSGDVVAVVHLSNLIDVQESLALAMSLDSRFLALHAREHGQESKIYRVDLDRYFTEYPWHCHWWQLSQARPQPARASGLELQFHLDIPKSLERAREGMLVSSHPSQPWYSRTLEKRGSLGDVVVENMTSRVCLTSSPCPAPLRTFHVSSTGQVVFLSMCGKLFWKETADGTFQSAEPTTSDMEIVALVLTMQGDRWCALSSTGYLFSLLETMETSSLTCEAQVVCRVALACTRRIAMELARLNEWTHVTPESLLVDVVRTQLSHGLLSDARQALRGEWLQASIDLRLALLHELCAFVQGAWQVFAGRTDFAGVVDDAKHFALQLVHILYQNGRKGHLEVQPKLQRVTCHLRVLQSVDFFLNHRGSRDTSHFLTTTQLTTVSSPIISFHWRSRKWIALSSLSCPSETTLHLDGVSPNRDGESLLKDEFPHDLWSLWENLSVLEIVQYALVQGKVSSAVAFLSRQCVREEPCSSLQHLGFLDHDCSYLDETLRLVHRIGRRLVYKLVSNDQVDYMLLGTQMLLNLGENVEQFFKLVAFRTTRRATRWRLLRHVQHTLGLSPEERRAADFLSHLEQLYPSPSFIVSLRRSTLFSSEGRPSFFHFPSTVAQDVWQTRRDMWGKHLRRLLAQGLEQQATDEMPDFFQQVGTQSATMEMGDMDDFGLRVAEDQPGQLATVPFSWIPNPESLGDDGSAAGHSKYNSQQQGARSCTECEQVPLWGGTAWSLGQQQLGDTAQTWAYLHVNLEQVLSWSAETKERILIDKGSDLEHRCLVTLLGFHAERANIDPVLKILSKLPIRSYHATDQFVRDWFARWSVRNYADIAFQGDDHPRFRMSSIENMCTIEEGDEFVVAVIQYLRFLAGEGRIPSFFVELVRKWLAAKGLFLTEQLDPIAASRDGQGLASLAALDETEGLSVLKQLASCHILFGPSPSTALSHVVPLRAWSPFHLYFAKFCVENELTELLVCYLDSFDLGRSTEDMRILEECCNFRRHPLLASSLLRRIGAKGSLLEATLLACDVFYGHQHIELLLENGDQQSALPVVLGAMCFADEDVPFLPNIEMLVQVLEAQAFPTLAQAVSELTEDADQQDVVQTQGDVPLWRDFVSSKADITFGAFYKAMTKQHGLSLDLEQLRMIQGWLDQGVHFTAEKTVMQSMPLGERSETLEFSRSSAEAMLAFLSLAEVGPEQCLIHGMGTLAYLVFLARWVPNFSLLDQERLYGNRTTYLSPTALREAQQLTRRVVFSQLGKKDRQLACIWFLRLLKLSATDLSVDSAALKAIFDFHPRAKSDPHFKERVVSMFLEFPSPTSMQGNLRSEEPVLMKALKLLGEAGWASRKEVNGDTDRESLHLKLESSFCSLHKLPFSLAFLHELARKNDVLGFLYEAQIQSISPEICLGILHDSFQDIRIQGHLTIVINALLQRERDTKSTTSYPSRFTTLTKDLIAVQENLGHDQTLAGHDTQQQQVASTDSYPGKEEEDVNGDAHTDQHNGGRRPKIIRGKQRQQEGHVERGSLSTLLSRFLDCCNGQELLGYAQMDQQPYLAVIASGCGDVSLPECFVTWISSQTTLPPFGKDLDAESRLFCSILYLLETRNYAPLFESLTLFAGESSLEHFVAFHRAFANLAFVSAERHLGTYASLLSCGAETSLFAGEKVHLRCVQPELVRLFRDFSACCREDDEESRLRLRELLFIVNQCKLPGVKGEGLYKVVSHLERECSILVSSKVLGMDAEQIVGELLSTRRYSKAREYLSLCLAETDGDTLTSRCCAVSLEVSKLCSERILLFETCECLGVFNAETNVKLPTVEAWRHCSELFKRHAYDPVHATCFFAICLNALSQKIVPIHTVHCILDLICEWGLKAHTDWQLPAESCSLSFSKARTLSLPKASGYRLSFVNRWVLQAVMNEMPGTQVCLMDLPVGLDIFSDALVSAFRAESVMQVLQSCLQSSRGSSSGAPSLLERVSFSVFDTLINDGRLTEAELISDQLSPFGVDNRSVLVARFALDLAQLETSGRLTLVQSVNRKILSILPPTKALLHDNTQDVLQQLVQCRPTISFFLSQVILTWRVSRFLLREGESPSRYCQICRENDGIQIVADLLKKVPLFSPGYLFFKPIASRDTRREGGDFEEGSPQMGGDQRYSPTSEHFGGKRRGTLLDDRVVRLVSDVAAGFPALNGQHIAQVLCTLVFERLGGLEMDEVSNEDCVKMVFNSEDFELLVKLVGGGKNAAFLGVEASRVADRCPIALRIEIFLVAFHAYLAGGDKSGMREVLRKLDGLAKQLATSRQFALLVRVLHGSEAFETLRDALSELLRHQAFNLIVDVANGVEDDLKRIELKLALSEFLEQEAEEGRLCFEDMTAFFTSMEMYYHLAWLLYERGTRAMTIQGARSEFPFRHMDLTELAVAQHLLLQAARYFVKPDPLVSLSPFAEDPIAMSRLALSKARLAGLQIECTERGVCVLNLSLEEIDLVRQTLFTDQQVAVFDDVYMSGKTKSE